MTTSTAADLPAATRHGIEINAIGQIPANQRHGRPRDQFTLWFGLNANIFPVVIGGVIVSMGLSFAWACLAIATGLLIGLLLVGFHAIQGPRLGVPQMIQSRGQFGFYGAVLVFAASIVLDFGYLAAQLVIQAEAMNVVVPALSLPQWIAVLSVPVVVLTIYGHDLLHRTQRWMTIVLMVTFAILAVQTVIRGAPSSSTGGPPTLAHFMASAGLLVIGVVSWAPYVSDYSRYLPADTSARRTFWAVSLGITAPAFVCAALGAWIAVLLPHESSTVAAIGKVSGNWILIVMALSLLASDVANAYTGMLALAGIVSCFRNVERSVAMRVIGAVVLTGAGTVAALLGYRHFVTNLSNLLGVLLFVFIPWSAINLTDYYIVRRGHYDVASFFKADGRYGGVLWRGVIAYLLAVAVQVPFIDQTYLHGALVDQLGGLDISWLVGGIAGLMFYVIAMRLGRSEKPLTTGDSARRRETRAPHTVA